MKFKKIVIIGMGLIGGSIGKALIEKNLADEVTGVCRRQSSLDRAIKEKSLSTGYVNSYDEAVPGADVVFIATPVHIIKEVLEGLSGVLKDGKTLVTDVGSTKKEIVDYADRFKDSFSFVGGHPLAGSEKTGVEYAEADLFRDSLCVLTRGGLTSEEDLQKLHELWQAMGARVDVVTPEEHDGILSLTSHLPHIVAYALAGSQKAGHSKYMSTGFKDATRIASSDPALWSDIFISNRDNVLSSIGRFKELLSGIEDDIRNGREEPLKKKLETFKKIRDDIF
ncbi:MAG: prephenate dehydrogenase [Candidatus Omnitrophota bacterium]